MVRQRLRLGLSVLVSVCLSTSLRGQQSAPRHDLSEESSGSIDAVAFNPDGTILASTRDYTRLRLWDTRTGQPLATIDGYARGIGHGSARFKSQALQFSPDGRLLAGGSSFGYLTEGLIFVWDVSDPAAIGSPSIWKAHAGGVTAIAFTPDSRTLISASLDQEIKCWDVASQQELRTLVGHKSRILGMALSDDGARLASGDPDEIKLWDLAAGKETASMKTTLLIGLDLSAEGTTLAVSTESGATEIWNVSADPPARQRTIDVRGWPPVVFHPDGRRLATANSDRRQPATVELWDIDRGRGLNRFQHGDDFITCMAMSRDGRLLATGGANGLGRARLLLWELAIDD
jgi:WD40 repeat protein